MTWIAEISFTLYLTAAYSLVTELNSRIKLVSWNNYHTTQFIIQDNTTNARELQNPCITCSHVLVWYKSRRTKNAGRWNMPLAAISLPEMHQNLNQLLLIKKWTNFSHSDTAFFWLSFSKMGFYFDFKQERNHQSDLPRASFSSNQNADVSHKWMKEDTRMHSSQAQKIDTKNKITVAVQVYVYLVMSLLLKWPLTGSS